MPLVFVPTPLGNLRDITLRAIDVLRESDLVVAEDSRVARKLLSALAIKGKEIWSYHGHNAKRVQGAILERARSSLVAVLSDAGMPGISDPGSELVRAAREAGLNVQALPGPNAAVCAALLSGFPLKRFTFEGFPPRPRGARRAAFQRSFASGMPSVWYESPQRIHETLADVGSVDAAALVFLLREFTKRYEQQALGTAGEVARELQDPARGEITFVVMPSVHYAGARAAPDDLDERIDAMLSERRSVAAIAKAMAAQGYGQRGDLYARAAARKQRTEKHA